jgi:DNA repair protein RadA/Sms
MSVPGRTFARMAKTAGAGRAKQAFRCAECGWQSAKWVGRCGECQAWGTVGEAGAAAAPPRLIAAGPVTAPARPIGAVDVRSARSQPTGLDELDRVLGGGLVPGAVALLAGEPGIGKSTLLLEVAALASSARPGHDAADKAPVLYVTGEESAEQVRLRADRVGAVTDRLYLAAESELAAVLGHVDAVRPKMLVVDSIQTIGAADADGAPGGVTQIREVTANLIRVAKERAMTVVLVGHVTKDGAIAGPRLLEHLVDVVLHFEGDRHSRLRMIRAVKNRFGPTDELGCFDLSEMGIVGLPDPSGLFLTRRDEPVPGTCVTVTLEGRRPLVAEVQALVARSFLPSPRRATSGLDAARVGMVLAVLGRRCRIAMHEHDVYASTVGGVRLAETSVDLAVALAVAGSKAEQALSPNVIALGEVGLAGEVRVVPGVRRRLAEAGRLGFTCAVVPRGSLRLGELMPLKPSAPPGSAGQNRDDNVTSSNGQVDGFAGMRVMEVDSLNQALQVAFTTA